MSDLEWESLRPTTRRRFVLEIGLAVAMAWLKVWLAALALLAALVAVVQPGLLASSDAVIVVVGSLCVEMLLLGLMLWICSLRSIWFQAAWIVVGFVLFQAFGALVLFAAIAPTLYGCVTATLLLVAAAVAIASMLTAAAYYRWSTMELGAKWDRTHAQQPLGWSGDWRISPPRPASACRPLAARWTRRA